MGQVLQNHAKRRERQETVLQVRYGENAKNTVVANNVEFLPSEDEKGVKRPLEEIAYLGGEGGHMEGKAVLHVLGLRLRERFHSRRNERNSEQRRGLLKLPDECGQQRNAQAALE